MLSERSRERLRGVHPDLVRVVEAASERCAFHVTEGLRSVERQKQLYAAGKSKTLKSRHITGHAVDLVAARGAAVSYADADMHRVAAAIKAAANDCGVPIEWGGDWKSFVDTPHFQLPIRLYPADGPPTPTSMLSSKEGAMQVVNGTAGGGIAVDGAWSTTQVVLEKAAATNKAPTIWDILAALAGSTQVKIGIGIMAAAGLSWFWRAQKRWHRGI